jgi:hypothetical protein
LVEAKALEIDMTAHEANAMLPDASAGNYKWHGCERKKCIVLQGYWLLSRTEVGFWFKRLRSMVHFA